MNENLKIKNRLMAQLYAIKQLNWNKEKWNNEFIPKLRTLFNKYKDSIHLHHIGFIEDWEKFLEK